MMKSRTPHVLATILFAVIFAGCIGGDDEVAGDNNGLADDAEDAKVTGTTGAIKGTVASDLFEPLAGALVVLIESGQETRVARNGEFTINEVAPGRHTIQVAAGGFISATRAVNVEAGQVTQVGIQLSKAPSTDPYVEPRHVRGEISSSVIWQAEVPTQGCMYGPLEIGYDKTCGGFGGGTRTHLYDLAVTDTVETLIVELVWDPAGPLGEYLQLDVICPDAPRSGADGNGSIQDTEHPCYYLAPGAKSPLVVRVDRADSIEHGYNWVAAWHGRVFANYGMLGTYDATGFDAGVAYQQPFDWYITTFHREPAPEGFSGIPDR